MKNIITEVCHTGDAGVCNLKNSKFKLHFIVDDEYDKVSIFHFSLAKGAGQIFDGDLVNALNDILLDNSKRVTEIIIKPHVINQMVQSVWESNILRSNLVLCEETGDFKYIKVPITEPKFKVLYSDGAIEIQEYITNNYTCKFTIDKEYSIVTIIEFKPETSIEFEEVDNIMSTLHGSEFVRKINIIDSAAEELINSIPGEYKEIKKQFYDSATYTENSEVTGKYYIFEID